MSPQNETILAHLKAGRGLTTLEAMHPPFNCCRLSERIREIEASGFPCNHDRVKVGKKTVTRYSLKKQVPKQEDFRREARP